MTAGVLGAWLVVLGDIMALVWNVLLFEFVETLTKRIQRKEQMLQTGQEALEVLTNTKQCLME